MTNIFSSTSTYFRFVGKFNEIYEFVIIAVFFWTLSTVCCSLLALQFALAEILSNPFQLMEILFMLLWSFGLLGFFCEFGEMVTNQFELFDVELWQCDWYFFPMKLQRMLVLIMTNTQKTTQIQGYANTLCSRSAFKEVKNWIRLCRHLMCWKFRDNFYVTGLFWGVKLEVFMRCLSGNKPTAIPINSAKLIVEFN